MGANAAHAHSLTREDVESPCAGAAGLPVAPVITVGPMISVAP